jgi:uncharacterized membrane protein YphA (DoxX/SURF4 family)
MDNMMINEARSRRNLFIRIFSFSWVKKSTLVEIISLWFVILFLYTGVAKLMDFDVFKAQLEESPVLEPVAPIVTWGLPVIEFIVCILLFFPRWRLKGLYAAFGLMVIFTGYVIALLTTSTELPCSCGGIIEALSWQGHLIFNTSMILLSFASIRIERKAQKLTQERPYKEPSLTSHV